MGTSKSATASAKIEKPLCGTSLPMKDKLIPWFPESISPLTGGQGNLQSLTRGARAGLALIKSNTNLEPTRNLSIVSRAFEYFHSAICRAAPVLANKEPFLHLSKTGGATAPIKQRVQGASRRSENKPAF